MSGEKRIAVTGMGAVTPFGLGVTTFWSALMESRSAIHQTEDEQLARYAPVIAQIHDFQPANHLPRKLVKDTDRFAQLALIAAAEALMDAGLKSSTDGSWASGVDGDSVGIAVGSALGGVQTLDAAAGALSQNPEGRVSPRVVPKSLPNAAAGALAIHHGARGPVMTTTTACAAAANAIGEGMHWLLRGDAEVVLAGGAECLFSPIILAGLKSAGALAQTGPADYSQWSRPFDVNRAGMVMSEGGAFLVLEPLHRAIARGAKVYALLSGAGASNDAYHETSPHPDGTGAELAMRRALKSANLSVTDIDYVNAHATATPAGDLAESKALHRLLGDHIEHTPVSSIKGAVGHMLGAAGAIESIASILAIVNGQLPPTLHCDEKEAEAPPDIVPNHPRSAEIEHVLSNSFGFGGQNGVLIFSRY
jgi:3-oxoacyl-[acyl-carrier-protein] synthase II